MTLVTQLLMRPGGVKEAQRVLAGGGPRVATINHPFATFPNLESDTGEAAERLLRAIDNRVQRLNLARHSTSVRSTDKDRLDIKANASPVGLAEAEFLLRPYILISANG